MSLKAKLASIIIIIIIKKKPYKIEKALLSI